MRIRHAAGATSWKYAIGEVLLIVIGVLIALAASNWQDRRADRRAELAVLREIGLALKADATQLEATLLDFESIEARGDVLLSYIGSNAPYADSLDSYFGAMYGVAFRVRPNIAAYESLKSQGLRMVSNEDLRFQITRVYEQTYANIEESQSSERSTVLDVLRPYFIEHFKNLTFGRSATPLSYNDVKLDQTFVNLMALRLQVIRQNNIPTLRRAITAIRELSEAIRSETNDTDS